MIYFDSKISGAIRRIDIWSGTGTSQLILDKTHSGCVSGWTYTLKINGTIGGVASTELVVSATC